MARDAQTLNIYSCTDATANAETIVAEDMATAAQVYRRTKDVDPIIIQRTKAGVQCVRPDFYVNFSAEAYNQTTSQIDTACKVTPTAFTVLSGTKQIFTCVLAEGYEFVKWQIDGADVEDATEPVAQLTIPEGVGGQVKVRAVVKLAD